MLERRGQRFVEGAGDALGGLAFLDEDPVDHAARLLVAGALCHPLELLVAADLEMLERPGEGRELRRGVPGGLGRRLPS